MDAPVPMPERGRTREPGGQHLELLRTLAREVREQVAPAVAQAAGDLSLRVGETDRRTLSEAAHAALSAGLDALFDPARDTESAAYLTWVGDRGARHGIPLEALVRTHHTVCDLTWHALIRAARARGPEATRLAARAASSAWDLYERDSTVMTDAYRRASREVVAERGSDSRALTALLSGPLNASAVADAAAQLSLPEQGRFAVAVVRLGATAPQPGADADSAPDGCVVRRAPAPGGEVLLAEVGALSSAGFARLVTVPSGARMGVSPVVTGLAAASQARELAELALHTCRRDGEAAVLDRGLSAALVTRGPHLAPELAAGTLGGLLEERPAERDLLLETLACWLDEDGSVERAAAALYCHPNTVRRRLRRLEQLTARSLSRPHDVVHLTLGLDAHRLAAAAAGPR
ncbi:helix-turn-helix domain-containing protein [Streptomyces sp. NBC_00656]|uniref:helix-turn-helix domain-containing protein n=1 Tax=Streptomyces sp. NBC_00656 TaxID=2903668 RepID=UPI003253C002